MPNVTITVDRDLLREALAFEAEGSKRLAAATVWALVPADPAWMKMLRAQIGYRTANQVWELFRENNFVVSPCDDDGVRSKTCQTCGYALDSEACSALCDVEVRGDPCACKGEIHKECDTSCSCPNCPYPERCKEK